MLNLQVLFFYVTKTTNFTSKSLFKFTRGKSDVIKSKKEL